MSHNDAHGHFNLFIAGLSTTEREAVSKDAASNAMEVLKLTRYCGKEGYNELAYDASVGGTSLCGHKCMSVFYFVPQSCLFRESKYSSCNVVQVHFL